MGKKRRGGRTEGRGKTSSSEIEPFSVDEILRVEPERADFPLPDAHDRVLDATHVIKNTTHRATLAIKLKCTDLDHYTIKPATAIIKPGKGIKLRIQRQPHKPRKDQKVDIYYTHYRGDDPNPNVGSLFKRRGEKEHVTLLLRMPKDLPKDKGRKARGRGKERIKARSVDVQEDDQDDGPGRTYKTTNQDSGDGEKKTPGDKEKNRNPSDRERRPKEAVEEARPEEKREKGEARSGSEPEEDNAPKSPPLKNSPDANLRTVPPKERHDPMPTKPAPTVPPKERQESGREGADDGGGRKKQKTKPPPLQLEDPHLKCLFFPPFDEPNQISFIVVNPSEKRVAVKMKCSDLSQFEIKPTYMFLRPNGTEEVVVKRLPVGPPKAGKRPELLAMYNVEVGAGESDWKQIFKSAAKDQMNEVHVELEVRNEPYLDAREAVILFYRPHSLKSIATLSLKNISPFYTIAKCYCGNNDTFRVNPVRMIIPPDKLQFVHFSVAKLPVVEAKIEVDYVKTTEEVGKMELPPPKLKEVVDAALKKTEGGDHKIQSVHAVLRGSEENALKAEPSSVTMKWLVAESKWFGAIQLRNLSSAHLAVKVKALDPKRYLMSLAKMILEPNGERELTVTEKTEGGKEGPMGESAIKLEFAYCLNLFKSPDLVIGDAKDKDGMGSVRLFIHYDSTTYPATGPTDQQPQAAPESAPQPPPPPDNGPS